MMTGTGAQHHPLGSGGQRTLNSLTKYPSIPTYHTLNKKTGGLSEPCVDFYDAPLVVTEKVDGTNGRIIQLPDGDYFIGSREELLYARGDRIHNPHLNIVTALWPLAERLIAQSHVPPGNVRTLYLEVYGAGITGGKNYTSTSVVGYRLFDVNECALDALDWTPEQAAAWRERGGQPYLHETQLRDLADDAGIPLVPRITDASLCGCITTVVPSGVIETHEWLKKLLPETAVALDDGGTRKAEGVVVRTHRRETIAKIRFEDYQRTEWLAAQAQRAPRMPRTQKPLTRRTAS